MKETFLDQICGFLFLLNIYLRIRTKFDAIEERNIYHYMQFRLWQDQYSKRMWSIILFDHGSKQTLVTHSIKIFLYKQKGTFFSNIVYEIKRIDRILVRNMFFGFYYKLFSYSPIVRKILYHWSTLFYFSCQSLSDNNS